MGLGTGAMAGSHSNNHCRTPARPTIPLTLSGLPPKSLRNFGLELKPDSPHQMLKPGIGPEPVEDTL
jgi:hypothetical protein